MLEANDLPTEPQPLSNRMSNVTLFKELRVFHYWGGILADKLHRRKLSLYTTMQDWNLIIYNPGPEIKTLKAVTSSECNTKWR